MTTAATSDAALLAELRGLLRDALGVDPVQPIAPETRFFADLGLASIDAVVLGEAIQGHYGRPVPFDRLMADLGSRQERDLSIGELIEFLKLHL
ncbi:MAG: acyl carrier protein [Candidatus Limnocylindrales bacterium]|jgi:acyl carrier protein